ncbi:leucyl/phenylalanyl-tRNA--protein transferase [Qipengyuania sp. DY56-A-20]|jgi:leucyl/phenylalanyl-tRNA--protein transferase|uniref:Leucyl/phenylalanyl-tRNA--protein transferase n=1 Tax=Qipengyuania benthica TaxID=3067651 RepID=A0ABT9H5B5_9SPHN|nr:leucyl/phenylalanyl-tRNA--protein transferase [Qipengyuania sp. DY56-A-20]MDP4538418.1 leucyl/phenylalanyl-tRNA--protein transferase [Qipengyuania sp. DY56-A-20]
MHAPPPDSAAVTAPIPTQLLLRAYRAGVFPMADYREDEEVYWVEPRERAIIPLEGFHASRSLRKLIRSERFAVTLDGDFDAVIDACAQPREEHAESWISLRIEASYRALHRAGHAHSVECRLDGELVGGLYGVAFDRVFCGESMFSRADNASKVALAWLVACMKAAGYRLLDCQFMTGHLASLGAVAIPQARYLELLAAARGKPGCSLPEAWQSFVQASGADCVSAPSPGNSIVQSLTQTS